jgi:SHAQKYF class myb-like DNA-binding protein
MGGKKSGYEEKSPEAMTDLNIPLDSNLSLSQGRWTMEEHLRFLRALKLHGKEWRKVQQLVGTRTSTQARSHA